MENNIKTWEVVYRHPTNGEEKKTVVFATSKKQATKMARENNVPTMGKSFFWEIVSIEEKVL